MIDLKAIAIQLTPMSILLVFAFNLSDLELKKEYSKFMLSVASRQDEANKLGTWRHAALYTLTTIWSLLATKQYIIHSKIPSLSHVKIMDDDILKQLRLYIGGVDKRYVLRNRIAVNLNSPRL